MTVQDQIPKDHLQKIGNRYEVNANLLTYVGGFENSVYSFSKEKVEFYLRVGNAEHMSFNLVQAEIKWVLHLLENDVPAVVPVSSKSGAYVENVQIDGSSYNVVAFKKAEGNHGLHTCL